jgi:inorganic pyrophosphatase
MSLKNVPFGEIEAFNVIVEVPTGSQKKYAYDSTWDAIKLTRVLYDEVKFPLNYGCVAETEGGDGENLDVFVISTHPISRGTVVTCRAVGMMDVIDRGKEDHKIIAVPLSEPRLRHIQELEDVPENYINALKSFFAELVKQWHKDIVIKGFFDKKRARKELLRTQILD